MTILAPYNTGSIPFLTRFLYWTGLCFAGGVGATAFAAMADRIGWKLSLPLLAIGESIFAAIVVTAFLVGLNLYRFQSIGIGGVVGTFFFVWVISIIITAIALLTQKANQPGQDTSTRPTIFERIKPSLRSAELYALSAEDHYVRVFTSKGEDLILMRLGDAIKESSPLPGLSVHRSWWVAETGVKAVKKSDGKLSLELQGGQIAPVSRSNAKRVRDAGWA